MSHPSPPSVPPAEAPRKVGGRLQLAMIAVGAGLFGVIVWRANPRQLWHTLAAFGFGFVLFIAIDGLSDIFHAMATYYCFSGENRRAPLRSLLYIRFTVRAYNFLTPTSGFGGDVVKGMLLQRYASAHEAASVVIIDKFVFGLTQFAMAFFGSAVMLAYLDIPFAAKLTFWGVSAALWIGFASFLVLQRHGWLGALLQRVVGLVGGPRAGTWMTQNLEQLDLRLRTYYRRQGGDLLLSIFWQALGSGTDIVLAWLFLYFLFGANDWMKATAIWCLGKWFDMMIFVVPGGLGTQELSRAFIFQSIHYQWHEGVAYAMVLRTNQLFWSLVGLMTHAIELRGKAADDVAAGRAPGIAAGQ